MPLPPPGPSTDGKGGAQPGYSTPYGAKERMAAKRKYAPPKPRLDLPWSQLSRARQNTLYTHALHAYAQGKGPNPKTSGEFARNQIAAEAK